MTNKLNETTSSYFSKPMQEALAPYNMSSTMGPKGVIQLIQDASKNGKTLQFSTPEKKDEFLLGLAQLTLVFSDLFKKLKKDLIFSANEEYDDSMFYQEYKRRTGTRFMNTESRLAAYELMINNTFLQKFGHVINRIRADEDYYNENAKEYNISRSNIISNIDKDYDSVNNKFLFDGFNGLDENLIKEFFVTMKEVLPRTLPLMEEAKHTATTDATKQEINKAFS